MALKMGKPNVVGTMVGILLLAVLLSGAALLGWTDWQRQMVRGGLLIAGVTAAVWTRRGTRARIGWDQAAGLAAAPAHETHEKAIDLILNGTLLHVRQSSAFLAPVTW